MNVAALMLASGLSSTLVAPPEPPAPVAEPPLAVASDEQPPPSPPAPPWDAARLQAALDRLPTTPSLAQVQAAALARAGVDTRVAERWRRRARTAAALPTVSVQYDRRFDRGWTLDRAVGDGDALRNDAGEQDVVRAKATWELDRLWFAPDELRAARAALDLADARERVLVEVTRLYFERERLLLERELAPAPNLEAAIAASVRLREIEGLLAGLTGLDFGPQASAGSGDLGHAPRE